MVSHYQCIVLTLTLIIAILIFQLTMTRKRNS